MSETGGTVVETGGMPSHKVMNSRAKRNKLQSSKKAEKSRLFHFKCREARGTGCLSLNGLRVRTSGLEKTFAQMPHLSHVYLSGCHLHGDVPEAFTCLSQLDLLDLSDNSLDYLPPPALLQNQSLTVIDLSINKLTRLPQAIGKLPALRELNVAQNDLVDLPSDIGNLPDLETLNVSHNLLRTLPMTLCTGPVRRSLRVVRVQNNVLVELPEKLGQLTELEELDIRDNNLHALPANARALTKLQVLHYTGNRWPVPIVPTSPDVKQQQLASSYGTRALETLYRLITGNSLMNYSIKEDICSTSTIGSEDKLKVEDLSIEYSLK